MDASNLGQMRVEVIDKSEERWILEEERKDRLMHAAAVQAAALPIGMADREGVAVRTALKLEKLLDVELALGR